MTPTLALSPLPTGIQSVPVAGRALPEFDLALAELSPPASTPVVTAAILQNTAEPVVQGASAKMTFSVPPTMVAQIPDDVVRLLGQDDVTGETAQNEVPAIPSVPVIAVRPRMAVGARGTLLEPELEQAAVPDDTLADEADLSPTDNNQDAATMDNVVAKPGAVCIMEPSVSLPIKVLPSVENAPAPPAARTGSVRSPRDETKVDADIAMNLASLPGKPLEANVKRQSGSAGTVSLSKQDAPTKTVTSLAVEWDAKSNAFETALTLSNPSTPSSDIRNAPLSPAHGLNELSGAHGVAERHLNLARDTMWLDQLASDIVSASDQTDRISFRLMPAHLGQLDVDLVTSDAGLSVNIATSTNEAGKIVASAQSGLVESLQAQGVRVADTHVTSGNDMSRQNQPQRQNAADHLIETAFSGADDPVDENDDRPDGRFA